MAAAEAALQHAWAALDADLHKQARQGVHPFLTQFHAGEWAGAPCAAAALCPSLMFIICLLHRKGLAGARRALLCASIPAPHRQLRGPA